MTETVAKYEVEKRPDVEIMVIPDVEFQFNALRFHRRLDDATIEQLFSGLRKFKEGYQWFFSDAWWELENLGYEWTDWIPESIALGTAQTWRKVGNMFIPDDRRYSQLQFSHYAATRKLGIVDAHKILEAANENGWPEKAVREAVDLVLGKPEKAKKPKVVQCKHCDRWIADIEDEVCPFCALDVAEGRVKGLRDVLRAIRDSEENNLGLYAKFTVELAVKALEGI